MYIQYMQCNKMFYDINEILIHTVIPTQLT